VTALSAEIQRLPLAQLVPSPFNVRSVRTEAWIAEDGLREPMTGDKTAVRCEMLRILHKSLIRIWVVSVAHLRDGISPCPDWRHALFFALVLCVLLPFGVRAEVSGQEEVAEGFSWVVEPRYDEAADFVSGLARVKVNGKYGFINEKGEEVIPPHYDYLGSFDTNGLAVVRANGKCGFVNKDGEGVVKPNYDDCRHFISFGKRLGRVKANGKYGYINQKGMEVIKPRYDETIHFRDNGLAWAKFNGKWRLINEKGEEVIRLPYGDIVDVYKNGLAIIKANGKYGYANIKEKVVIKPRYDNVADFSGGLMKVEMNGKYGYVNEEGKEVIKPRYQNTYLFENGLVFARVNKNEKWGLIGEKGREVIKPRYDGVAYFDRFLSRVETDGKIGFVNDRGEEVIFPCFDKVERMKNGFARVWADGKIGFINQKGGVVVQPRFDGAEDFAKDGLARVMMNKKWGYINQEGEEAIEPRFDESWDFSANGLARVAINGKMGFINRKGEMVIELRSPYWAYGDFLSNGLAVIFDPASENGGFGLINEKGEEVLAPRFVRLDGHFSPDGLMPVSVGREIIFVNGDGTVYIYDSVSDFESVMENKNGKYAKPKRGGGYFHRGKYGYINIKGEEIIAPRFVEAGPFSSNGLAWVRTEQGWCYINEKGEEVTRPIHGDTLSWHYPVSHDLFWTMENVRYATGKFTANGLAWINVSGKYGYINEKDEIIIATRFDEAADFSANGLARVRVGKKWGYIKASRK
jgi:hypothetical protein